MKEKIMKLLLLLLGFGTTACNEAENPVEYGCPMTKFSIKARVTDTSDRPIEGIKVEAVRYSSSKNADVSFDPNEAYSDSEGEVEPLEVAVLSVVVEAAFNTENLRGRGI